ncbi:GCN5-related N-acetyltransferase; Histone acetyltransferase HPA2 and related acetyltransferases [Burkholderia diffusa]|uniref:GNAT family N-acetyltransferase n=1 Tax=Burkholderia diffusa TaxID=488732 RepID=UPI001CAF39F9|nr:GNAT family N-acetyltransferase [Burkholderia diffusa]CAG9264491.1 GCN5-related N-acetyltransferase; Histone acetyltransferase HPA2 and related acetyltransferases [Burkholderia diffusa]
MTLRAPVPLTLEHAQTGWLETFDSGQPSLDDWLRRRALRNQGSGATRTFVVCDDQRVVAYYALASGAVDVAAAPGRFRRNMPDPVPVVVLARLAVDRVWQGHGLGRGLLRDAALRVVQAADTIGIRGLLAHALSHDALRYYVHLGFEPSPLDPMTVMITLADLRAAMLRYER